ncbi:MAG: class I SAM-dependent methyltransferase [Pseudomonadota bacterium]
MPTDEELARYYATVYRAEYQFLRRRPSDSHQRRKSEQAKERVATLGKFVDLSAPLRILEIGCGSGEMVRALAAMGHEAHGIEPNVDFATHAARDLPANAQIHTGGWEAGLFPAHHFDVIICLHVIEHLNRPLDAIRQIRAWLGPGGTVMLEVPDMRGYKTKGFDRFHFAHTLGFNRECLHLALEKCDLYPIKFCPTTLMIAAALGDRRAQKWPLELRATAQEIRDSYQRGSGSLDHLKRHLGRLWRTIGHEMGRRK